MAHTDYSLDSSARRSTVSRPFLTSLQRDFWLHQVQTPTPPRNVRGVQTLTPLRNLKGVQTLTPLRNLRDVLVGGDHITVDTSSLEEH